jgi:NAD(P)-dependent dehydrogenase (short-subunit alcohol dehydrogenase family)
MSDDAQIIDVTDRVAMISGASRGLGEAIARRLIDDGYRVSLGVRDVDATKKKFAGVADDRILVEHFDALDAPTAESWYEATLAKFGELHALVNNAGIWRQVNFEKGTEDDLDAQWNVNVKGPFRLTRLAMPELKKAGNGRIVNVASTDGVRFRDNSCSIGYTMSKHALVAMSHAARQFGYEDGVRVTALCPGAIATELVAGLPGVTPLSEQLAPATVAHIIANLLSLPNNASVAWMPVNTRLESTL